MKVIVLDDSEVVLDVIAMALEDAGHEVVAVTDHAELGETCRRENAEVAVIDLGLPGLRPDEVAALVRREVACPVILYSDRAGDELARLVAASGARAGLPKDPDAANLIAVLAELRRATCP